MVLISSVEAGSNASLNLEFINAVATYPLPGPFSFKPIITIPSDEKKLSDIGIGNYSITRKIRKGSTVLNMMVQLFSI